MSRAQGEQEPARRASHHTQADDDEGEVVELLTGEEPREDDFESQGRGRQERQGEQVDWRGGSWHGAIRHSHSFYPSSRRRPIRRSPVLSENGCGYDIAVRLGGGR